MPYTEYTRENTLKIAEKNMERQFQDLVISTTFFPNFSPIYAQDVSFKFIFISDFCFFQQRFPSLQ